MVKMKVLVVDDEKPARETLTYLIDWNSTAFEIVATAKNGREALEKYNDFAPDLIITDIQMPVMDGLSLIKAIKDRNRWTKFVILSCHEQFSYAKEAIQIGVTDYLIKDMMTPQDVYTTLDKVQIELEEQERLLDQSFRTTLIAGEELFQVARPVALKTIILDDLPMSKKTALLNEFKLNLKASCFVLFLVCLDKHASYIGYDRWAELENRVCGSIEKILAEGLGGECFYHQNGEFIVIANLEESASELKHISKSFQIAQRIYRSLLKVQDFTITIGISQGFFRLCDSIKRYEEVKEAVKDKVLLGKEKIIFYNTKLNQYASLTHSEVVDKIAKINTYLQQKNLAKVEEELRILYGVDLQGYVHYSYLKEINAHMYGLIINFVNTYGIRYEELFGCNYIPFQQVEDLNSCEEIGEWFNNVFAQIIRQRTVQDTQRYTRHVKAAVEYINTHYSRDISLSEIAGALSLHKVYLCRLFKQETGTNLINYIMKVRVEEAKKLMFNSENKLYKIAEQVGYGNIQKFSAAFKKMTGMTPREFRQYSRRAPK
ncbi:response regulator containing CheY-like receiver domain and AraC-type DNA-binding domain [Desulfosporosinus orientis DSM 765]|uniref:Stage 0 sporulation protein A homolog n=1 Tax=Desulfosporosinus orientis (strain ATCC 19365 / DSM 765 / NCIMB 8382 / VKM B-1628 / Singapore I) TaxID=768706 RepID=G7WBY4_DESOD|nr:response regulator [Desulfosporosinus orientis]AET69958.1 response regulator containing CheY-like receiver domain and AraC-type DNA-binding domain [Desulfosporosinus orientis DSM 765]